MVPSGFIGNADAGIPALQVHCRQLLPANIEDCADPLPECHAGQAQVRLGPRRLVALGMLHVSKLCIVAKHHYSRRRKTKCNGVRPKCGHCSSRKIPCEWPRASVALLNNSPPSLQAATVAQSPPSEPVLHLEGIVSDSGLPSRPALQRCLTHFFKRHFSNDFCSFSYKPLFEDKAMAHPFLATAVVSLCARYLSVHEAQHELGRVSTRELYKYASTLARRFARECSDQPSGT